MNYYTTRAFVLKKEIAEEKDNVYHFFTQDFGKINLKAKSSRDILAKLKGHLEVPTLVQINFSLTYQPRLISALEEEPYLNIKTNDAALSTALRIGQLVDELTLLNQKDLEIFNLLSETFYFLDRNLAKSPQLIDFSWFYFEAQFLKLLGYEPFLTACVKCAKKDVHYFSFTERGVVCNLHYHQEDLPLTGNQRKTLQLLFNISLRQINTIKIIAQILKEKRFLEEFLSRFTLRVKSDIM